MHDINHINGGGGDTQANSMGPRCKPYLSVSDFLWSLRIEAEIDKCVISPEFGWILGPQSPDSFQCPRIQELSLYASTRNFLGFSGSGGLKPKRVSLSPVVTLTF